MRSPLQYAAKYYRPSFLHATNYGSEQEVIAKVTKAKRMKWGRDELKAMGAEWRDRVDSQHMLWRARNPEEEG